MAVSDAPADYIESLLKSIVALEMTMTTIDAKVKLSQNKSNGDLENVMAHLARSTNQREQGTAAEMQKARERSAGHK